MTTIHKPIQIIGVPMDLGASRRGTDAGPSALRIAGLGSSLQTLGYKILLETDIPVPAMETKLEKKNGSFFKTEILSVCTQLANTTHDSLHAGALPLVIGGDHSIAIGTVSGVASFYKEKQQDIGLIWFDAHGDMNIPESSPSGNIHGMPLAHLLGYGDKQLSEIMGFRGKIKPENVALVGI
ncbi:MAG: arginase family protein, partial [Gammaproteobacteria bacterium]|nr:arginase family protein [Gammaproteobacteria bacterium]